MHSRHVKSGLVWERVKRGRETQWEKENLLLTSISPSLTVPQKLFSLLNMLKLKAFCSRQIISMTQKLKISFGEVENSRRGKICCRPAVFPFSQWFHFFSLESYIHTYLYCIEYTNIHSIKFLTKNIYMYYTK